MLQSGVVRWNGPEWSGVNVLKAQIFPHVDSEDPEWFSYLHTSIVALHNVNTLM